MSHRREVLILEPDAEGHSQEWLQHLAEFVAADATAAAISVVAPATLCAALSRSMPVVADGRIRFFALKPRELRLCTIGRCRSPRSPAGGRCAISQRSGADIRILLSIDLLCLPFAWAAHLRQAGRADRSGLRCTTALSATPTECRPRNLRDSAQGSSLPADAAKSGGQEVLSLDPFFPAHATSRLWPWQQGERFARSEPPGYRCGRPQHRGRRFCAARAHRVLLFGYLTHARAP